MYYVVVRASHGVRKAVVDYVSSQPHRYRVLTGAVVCQPGGMYSSGTDQVPAAGTCADLRTRNTVSGDNGVRVRSEQSSDMINSPGLS